MEDFEIIDDEDEQEQQQKIQKSDEDEIIPLSDEDSTNIIKNKNSPENSLKNNSNNQQDNPDKNSNNQELNQQQQQVNQYLQGFTKANFKPNPQMDDRKITILSAQTHKDWNFFDLTIYTIKSWQEGVKDSEFIIERRFSDFEWLYNQLRIYFIGYIIPQSPQKDFQAKLEFIDKKQILQQRQQGFIQFMNKLLFHKELRYSNILFQFLTQNSVEFQVTKDESCQYNNDFSANIIQSVSTQLIGGINNMYGYFMGSANNNSTNNMLTSNLKQSNSDLTLYITDIQKQCVSDNLQFDQFQQELEQQKHVFKEIKTAFNSIFDANQKQMQNYKMLSENLGNSLESQIQIQQKASKSYNQCFQDQEFFVQQVQSEIQESYRHIQVALNILDQRNNLVKSIGQQQEQIVNIEDQQEKQKALDQINVFSNRYRAISCQFQHDLPCYKQQIEIQLENINSYFQKILQENIKNMKAVWE